jgi:Tfp pilus assembly protein PilV
MKARVRGVALLEVLLALGVLTLGAVTAVALQVRGVQVFDQALRENLALQLAQGTLEQVRAAGRWSAGDEAQWQARVAEALGASAIGRFSPSGESLLLEVRWPASGAMFSLQGRVAP